MTLQRPWAPGESGNPSGRPKGIKNPAARLREMIDAEAIVKKLQEAALDGDTAASRTLLERALPVYRVVAEPIELPEMKEATTLAGKAAAVMDAVAEGRVPADLGAQMVAAIGSIARLIETDELTRRIEALENCNGKS